VSILCFFGAVGILFFFVNVFSGLTTYWFLRLCSILLSLVAVIAVSSRM
jgi:hypothetical protein